MGHRLRLLQGRLLPRHHQIPAGRLRQPLRLLPGLQRPGSGLFIGYDSGGWFWQTYTGGGSGSWYSGARIAAPSANEEHDIQVSWTDAKVATLTVDGQKAFDVDYSAMTNLSNKLAIKAGSWKGLNQVTDVYIKDFPEVVEAAKHAVSGKVVDAGGAAIEGATVRLDKTKVKTGADGTFSFADIEEGEPHAFDCQGRL